MSLKNVTPQMWVRIFENSGNFPGNWFMAAATLWSAANAIEDHTKKDQEAHGVLMPAIRAPEAMLRGMAIESCLKGLWLQRGPERKFVKDGRADMPAKFKKHNLVSLAQEVGIGASAIEEKALGRLSTFIQFAARYPIPLFPQDLHPHKVEGELIHVTFFGPDDFAVVTALWDRLALESGNFVLQASGRRV
jgi:hypothetical protein